MKFDVLRQRFLSSQFVGELKEGVEGRKQMKARLFSNLWQAAIELACKASPCGNPIEFGQSALVALDGRKVPTDVSRQFPKDVAISLRSSSRSISSSWFKGMQAPGSMKVTDPVLEEPRAAPLTCRL